MHIHTEKKNRTILMSDVSILIQTIGSRLLFFFFFFIFGKLFTQNGVSFLFFICNFDLSKCEVESGQFQVERTSAL